MESNFDLVIFGGTGDLALRKLYPAQCEIARAAENYEIKIAFHAVTIADM